MDTQSDSQRTWCSEFVSQRDTGFSPKFLLASARWAARRRSFCRCDILVVDVYMPTVDLLDSTLLLYWIFLGVFSAKTCRVQQCLGVQQIFTCSPAKVIC